MRIFFLTLSLAFFNNIAGAQQKITGIYYAATNRFMAHDTGIQVFNFHENRASFIERNRVGFIDTAGNIIAPAQYSLYSTFKNGIAILFDSSYKGGLIDSAGNILLPFQNQYMLHGDNGQILFINNGFVGLASKQGRIIVPADRYTRFFQPIVYREACDCCPERRNPYRINDYGRTFRLDNYIGVAIGRKWGYIDSTGEEVIPPKFDDIYYFNSGLAPVRIGHKKGLIDTTGKLLFSGRYDTLIVQSKEMIIAGKDKKMGIVDISGNEIIPMLYDAISLINEKYFLVLQNKKWGIIDRNNDVIIEPKYDYIKSFNSGYIVKQDFQWALFDKNGKNISGFVATYNGSYQTSIFPDFHTPDNWIYNKKLDNFEKYNLLYAIPAGNFVYSVNNKRGLIDSNGAVVSAPIYDIVSGIYTDHQFRFMDFSTGFIRVTKDGKYGLLDGSLHSLLPVSYDMIGDFYAGLAQVSQHGKYGFINTDGKLITDIKYDKVESFRQYEYTGKQRTERLALVKKDGKFGYVDKTGAEVTEIKYDYVQGFVLGYCIVSINNKTGLIDSMGKEVLPCQYESLERYPYTTKIILAKKDGKYAAINYKGEELTLFKYDRISQMVGDNKFYYTTTIDKKNGLLNDEGKEIALPLYDEVSYYKNGFCLLRNDKKYGFVAKEGETLVQPIYDEAIVAGDNLLIVRKDSLYGIVDANGKFLYPLKYKHIGDYSEGVQLTESSGKKIMIDKYQYIDPSRREVVVVGTNQIFYDYDD